MQDMETDLMAFDDFFNSAADEIDDGKASFQSVAAAEAVLTAASAEIWSIPRDPLGSEDHDLLDADDLQPLDPDEDKPSFDACCVSASRSSESVIKIEPCSPATCSRGDAKSIISKEEMKREPSLAERRMTLLAPVASAFTSSPRAKRRISEANMIKVDEQEQAAREAEQDEEEYYEDEDYYEEDEGGCCHDHGNEDDDELVLPDTPDYSGMPLLSDDDVAALVPSPTNLSAPPYANSSTAASATNTSNRPSGPVAPTSFPAPAQNASLSSAVSDRDIPDVVNLFNSLHSPGVSPTRETQALAPTSLAGTTATAPTSNSSTLRIVVPAPQSMTDTTPLTGTAPLPGNRNVNSSNVTRPPAPGMFDYFTPPGYMQSTAGPNSNFFLQVAADSLSPALKASLLQGQMSTAAAMAMANSAAALNTIRKLNTTYGVPIAPLQRSLTSSELPLKPKLAAGSSTTRISATVGSGSTNGKVTKISITPDIADFKLVQIFHNFCDPMTKVLTLPRFHQLLLHHQVKEESGSSGSSGGNSSAGGAAKGNGTGRSSFAAPPTATANATNITRPTNAATPAPASAPAPAAPGAISADAQHLFQLMDPSNSGVVDLERFMSSFQICNRCTEAKRRAHSALCAQQGQSFVPPTALERQLMEDVAPVIVRVVPTKFEGGKVKSCEHYQWTWCEGFDKTGNEKCRGTNRHDKCPKYLANCTLWKHKLPPKTRKPRASAVATLGDVLNSPSKKLKHFG